MSILIRGMEMPKNCGECPMICDYDLSREARGKEKAEKCPLIELPPHGRLIDADALYKESRERCLWWAEDYELGDMLDDIKNAPTIIESEGEDG